MAAKTINLLNSIKTKCLKNDERIANNLDLSLSEYNLLLTTGIIETQDCKRLQNEMSLSPSRFSRIVDKMVNNGYLIRTHNPNDRRQIKIELTSKGIMKKNMILKEFYECNKIITEHISEKEQKILNINLANIIEKL